MRQSSRPEGPWPSSTTPPSMADKSSSSSPERKPSEERPLDPPVRTNATTATDLDTGPLSAEDPLLEDPGSRGQDRPSLMREGTMIGGIMIGLRGIRRETMIEGTEWIEGMRRGSMRGPRGIWRGTMIEGIEWIEAMRRGSMRDPKGIWIGTMIEGTEAMRGGRGQGSLRGSLIGGIESLLGMR